MTISYDPTKGKSSDIITRSIVPVDYRVMVLTKLFGLASLSVEFRTYGWMEALSADYRSCYWHCIGLSNGGVYLVPSGGKTYLMSGTDFYACDLSADACGVVVSLLAIRDVKAEYSHPKIFSDAFFRLHEYAAQHTDNYHILRLIN